MKDWPVYSEIAMLNLLRYVYNDFYCMIKKIFVYMSPVRPEDIYLH